MTAPNGKETETRTMKRMRRQDEEETKTMESEVEMMTNTTTTTTTRSDTRVDMDDPTTSESDDRMPSRLLTETTDSMGSMTTPGGSAKRPQSWWDRVVSFGSSSKRRRQEEEDERNVDQDLYMRTILESYSSSLSSTRFSSVYHNPDRASAAALRSMSSRRAYTDENGGVYVAQPETPPHLHDQFHSGAAVLSQAEAGYDEGIVGIRANANGEIEEYDGHEEEEETILEDDDEKKRRRIQRRITQDKIRNKLLRRNQQHARTRKKLTIFALVIGLTLTAFVVAAMLIANVGVNERAKATTAKGKADAAAAKDKQDNNNAIGSTATTAPPPPPLGGGTSTPVTITPSPTTAPILGGTAGPVVGGEPSSVSDSSSGSNDAGSWSASTVPGRVNGTTLAPLVGRSGLDLLTPKPTTNSSSMGPGADHGGKWWHSPTAPFTIYTYAHCLLMSVSLWFSLVVIGMHITFKSFRTYSMPLVLELSIVQTGYWITSLLRVQLMAPDMDENLNIVFCVAECFFNFGQISFTCAIAFNMYRSVVSYADVLMDTQSAARRYRSYTINVMLLSLLASITLALVGYRSREGLAFDDYELCLYPTCRLILYVYYPLLAFGFNFVFYVRFKRTIGGAYPMSATGRLNSVARSYLVLFVVCWGSLITVTALRDTDLVPQTVLFTLQCVFDVLGVGTALITLMNFHRCRRAFDFGLSLKAIDPQSIEFEEPLQILGEGTFALVLRAKWHQRTLEGSDARTIDVAVKTFKHTQFETLEQMKEEAYLACKLVHPCVMMTYGCYTIGNNLYIVSEYLGGGTLQDVIDTSGRLAYDRVLRYAHMIAMGMRFLHGLPVPIIHRDLKPLNCIFDADKEMLKLADFGESRLFRKDGVIKQRPNFFPSFDLTLQMTTNIGSACWAAPEVLKDEAKTEYSLKVDVYSFGIICWQLYTCQVPYLDIPGSVLAVAEAVMGGRRPEIPSDCPTLFSKIMRRCWHEDPVRRPNFEDIVQLLEMEMSDLLNPRDHTNTNTKSPMVKSRSARKLPVQLTTPKSS